MSSAHGADSLPSPDELDGEIARAGKAIATLEAELVSGLRRVAKVGLELGKYAGNAMLTVGAKVLADIARGAITDIDLIGGEITSRIGEHNARLQAKLERRRRRREG